MVSKLKISFVEDNQIYHKALKMLLMEDDRMELLGAYYTAEAFLGELNFIQPDIVLMDIDLPGMSGLDAILKLKDTYEYIQKVIVLTAYDDSDKIFQALKHGADGYLLKQNTLENLTEEVLSVYDDKVPLSPQIAQKIINYFRTQKSDENKTLGNLSEKENLILDMVAQGYLNKEIADKTSISVDSVKKQIQFIYHKLQVRNRAEAIRLYFSRKSKIDNIE